MYTYPIPRVPLVAIIPGRYSGANSHYAIRRFGQEEKSKKYRQHNKVGVLPTFLIKKEGQPLPFYALLSE